MIVYFHDPFGNKILINDTQRKNMSVKRNQLIRQKVLAKYESEEREKFDIIRNSITNAWIEVLSQKEIENISTNQDIKMSKVIKLLEKQCYLTL